MTSEITKDESSSTAPFDAAPGSLDRIVGTRVFRDVLYSKAHVDRVTPDGLFSSDRAHEIKQNVTTARSIGIDRPNQVLVPQGTITLIAKNSDPFTSVVFFDQMVVRGRQLRQRRGPPLFEHNGYALEQLYQAAADSDHYTVSLVETDYETGSVTITVEKAA
jgi:hypothetical protein